MVFLLSSFWTGWRIEMMMSTVDRLRAGPTWRHGTLSSVRHVWPAKRPAAAEFEAIRGG